MTNIVTLKEQLKTLPAQPSPLSVARQLGLAPAVANKLLNNQAGSLSDLLGQMGDAPGSTTVVQVPEDTQASYIASAIADMATVESLIAVLAAEQIYSEHPEPYNLGDPKQAADFVLATANMRNFVMSGGVLPQIAAYLPQTGISTTSKTLNTTSVDFHFDFLKDIFSGIAISAAAELELDGIFTGIGNALRDLNLSFENQKTTLNHFLTFYYFEEVEGAEGYKIPKYRMIYLQINQESYHVSLGKAGTAQKFAFDMTTTTITGTLNSNLVSAQRKSLTEAIMNVSDLDVAEVNGKTRARTVTS